MEVNIAELSQEHSEHLDGLLAAGTELLHRYEDAGQALPRCAFCGAVRMYRDFAEECPLLLRHALERAKEAAAHFFHCVTCAEDGYRECGAGRGHVKRLSLVG